MSAEVPTTIGRKIRLSRRATIFRRWGE